VGAYALLLGQWVGRSGAVYAFEPAPDAFDGLCRHITLNDLQTVVHPVQAAVGAVPTNGRLLLATTSGESRLATPSENETAATNVLVTTVDEFCERHRLMPSFIKVDVEGAELDVLRGARETIRRSPALALFVEIHPTIWRRIGVTRDEFLDELARQSLDVESLVPGQDPWAVEGVALRLRPRTR
jgi:FkbM family methyltransferase